MVVQFQPLLTWPRERTALYLRKASPFRTSFVDTLHLLEKEVKHLRGDRIVIQGYFREYDIRVDGYPRAGANPSGPEILISFDSKFGPLQFMCDDCRRWTDNLYAIALTLERLRLADRYGVTRRGEQYTGWKALPPPAGGASKTSAGGFQNAEAALAWIAMHAGVEVKDLKAVGAFESTVRSLQKKFHPDLGGNAVDFTALQEARDLIEKNLAVLA